MKILTLLIAAGLWAIPLAGSALAADSEGVKEFTVGQFTITPILDRSGEMKIDLFSGPLTPEERAALMPGENLFAERLKSAGLTFEDIDLVLLTHMHPDHVGGLLKGTAPAFPKARVLTSDPELQYWQGLVEQAAKPDAKNTTPDPKAPPVAPSDLPGAVMAAYGDRLATFQFDDRPAEGFTALSAIGHTPGHTVFLLESEGKKLLFVGDILHAALLQFPQPDENASYDVDPKQAAASRRAVLNMAVEEGLPIAGAHIPFPGTGLVKKDGQGFAFTPTAEVL